MVDDYFVDHPAVVIMNVLGRILGPSIQVQILVGNVV